MAESTRTEFGEKGFSNMAKRSVPHIVTKGYGLY
jgi:hypothetical protein